MRKLTLSILASAAVLVASPALAQTVNVNTGSGVVNLANGGSTTIYFNGQENGTVYNGLSSNLMLTFTGYNAGAYAFSYTLNNTSTAVAGGRVVSFGFDANPNSTLALTNVTNTTVFDGVSSGSISNSFNVENCLTAGPNCAGGAGGGVSFGQSASGSFTLTPGQTTSLLSLTDFIDRYQSTNITPGGSGVGLPGGGPTVPEPATWAMMLVGFGAAGVSLRRRRKVTALQAA